MKSMSQNKKEKDEIAGVSLENLNYKILIPYIDYPKLKNHKLPSEVIFVPVAIEKDDVYAHLNSAENIKIIQPITNTLGLIAISEPGLLVANKIVHQFSAMIGNFEGEPYRVANVEQADELYRWVIESFTNRVRSISNRNVSLMRQLYAVRKDHEEMQEAFKRLEKYAALTFKNERELTLTLPESTQTIEMAGGIICNITQKIPCSSIGISDIAINVFKIAKEKNIALKVRLFKFSNNQTIDEWEISKSQVKEGWLRFSLNNCLGVVEESIGISIEGKNKFACHVSLSIPNPVDEWCAFLNGKSSGRTLAIKVWRGLPSTAPLLPSNATSHKDSETLGWRVPVDILSYVENLSNNPDFISYNKDKNSILVHPLNDMPIIARINSGITVQGKKLSARIESTNPNGKKIGFCMGVSPATSISLKKKKAPEFAKGYISEWQLIEPGESSEIHIVFPEILDVDHDIYLMTKIQKNESNENCWAYFSNLIISEM